VWNSFTICDIEYYDADDGDNGNGENEERMKE
jgi:hypothetical protein